MVSKNLGSVKRFGSRYGRTSRHKVGKIESMQRSKHMCPYCRKTKAKRQSVGIWKCESCNSKFTSKAYTVEIAKKTKKVAVEDFEVKEKVKSTGSKYSDNKKESEKKDQEIESEN